MPISFSDGSVCKNGGASTESRSLIDNYNRKITYLRLSVTDRCNLRCRYCCPEEGVVLVPHEEILSFEELHRLVRIFASLGVSKVRITGGEPFARRDLVNFLLKLKSSVEGLRTLSITTNGVQTFHHLEALKAAGVDGINLSLDTLDKQRFLNITRRDRLDDVLRTFHAALALAIPLKVNSVVLEDTEDSDLINLASLGKDNPVTVRFIERMPFSGSGTVAHHERDRLVARLRRIFPAMKEVEQSLPTTARIFSLPGYQGKIGVIEGNSRHFCSSCNKVRITATGMLKTCLYDNGVLDLRALLRSDCDDEGIADAIIRSVQKSFVDGHAAEAVSLRKSEPSMAVIGG
ncbi:MAG: GTP 3',8-cyclase MoaA [Desulfopila sp.]|jgi:cyclic pyranopterin phosphate synthase|nr:GTP 3',8-cyclase MoaA [Desulfopila sp.]